MQDDDKFLQSIPPFLRRTQEPARRKLPIRPRDLPETGSESKPRPAPAAAPTPPAAPPPSAARPPSAAPASSAAPPPSATPPVPKVVEVIQPPAAETPVAQRARIALAFENQDMAESQDMAEGSDGEDIAFRVLLPRGVARQIGMLAVERDTTQRAVVLRALRLAGISVPDDSDMDRRAKRQA